jgi:hypothetical protein
MVSIVRLQTKASELSGRFCLWRMLPLSTSSCKYCVLISYCLLQSKLTSVTLSRQENNGFQRRADSSNSSSVSASDTKRLRRTRVPDKPNYPLNLWSIMKNCIGKELSKIPMPVRTCIIYEPSTHKMCYHTVFLCDNQVY